MITGPSDFEIQQEHPIDDHMTREEEDAPTPEDAIAEAAELLGVDGPVGGRLLLLIAGSKQEELNRNGG